MTVTESIDRYVYAVTRRLPVEQRADIEKELRGWIEDRLEERAQGMNPTPEHVESVLIEMGNPGELADRYRGRKRYLISPELFPAYWIVMRIVLILIVALTVVEEVIDPLQVSKHLVEFFLSLVSALAQGFAWVTILFGIMEYTGLNPSKLGLNQVAQEWKPSMLAAVPDPSGRIKRKEPVIGLIATVFFTMILIAVLAGLAVHPTESGRLVLSHPFLDRLGLSLGHVETITSIFNIEAVRGYVPFIFTGMALYIVRDILKLSIGRWTAKLAVVSIAASVLWSILMIVMIGDPTLWNPHFAAELSLLDSGSNNEAIQTVIRMWEDNKTSWMSIIGLVAIAETAHTIVKVYRVRKAL